MVASYPELLAKYSPQAIDSAEEADQIQAQIDGLTDRDDLSTAENDLLILLTDVIATWEQRTIPAPDVPADQMLRVLLNVGGVKQKDLVPVVFPTKSIASEVIRGKRKLTYDFAARLAQFFGVSPAVFFSDRDIGQSVNQIGRQAWASAIADQSNEVEAALAKEYLELPREAETIPPTNEEAGLSVSEALHDVDAVIAAEQLHSEEGRLRGLISTPTRLDKEERSKVSCKLAMVDYGRGAVRSSLRFAKLAFDSTHQEDVSTQIKLADLIASCYDDLWLGYDALEWSDKAIDLLKRSEHMHEADTLGLMLKRSRATYKINLGDWRGAQTELEQCLTFARHMDHSETIPFIFSNLCYLSILMGDFDVAMEHWRSSLALKRKLGYGPRSLAYCGYYLAEIHLRRGTSSSHWDDACLAAIDKTMELFGLVEDERNRSELRLVYSRFLLRKGAPRLAIDAASHALKYAAESDLPPLEVQALRQLGLAYAESQNFEVAERYFERSLDLLNGLIAPYELALTRRALGTLYGRQHERRKEGLELLTEAIASFRAIGASFDVAETEREIIDCELRGVQEDGQSGRNREELDAGGRLTFFSASGRHWDQIEALAQSGEPVSAEILEDQKDGLRVAVTSPELSKTLENLRGLLTYPSLRHSDDAAETRNLAGRKIEFRIASIDRSADEVCVSEVTAVT